MKRLLLVFWLVLGLVPLAARARSIASLSEPTSLLLLGTAFIALGALARRQSARARHAPRRTVAAASASRIASSSAPLRVRNA